MDDAVDCLHEAPRPEHVAAELVEQSVCEGGSFLVCSALWGRGSHDAVCKKHHARCLGSRHVDHACEAHPQCAWLADATEFCHHAVFEVGSAWSNRANAQNCIAVLADLIDRLEVQYCGVGVPMLLIAFESCRDRINQLCFMGGVDLETVLEYIGRGPGR